MKFTGSRERITATGYNQQISYYQTNRCRSCFLKELCSQGKESRTIQINHRLRKAKEKVWKNLHSQQGIAYRKQRPADVETAYGQLKSNKGFRRFNLRGLKKVEIETGLLAIAHNLQKLGSIKPGFLFSKNLWIINRNLSLKFKIKKWVDFINRKAFYKKEGRLLLLRQPLCKKILKNTKSIS